ncbi:DNA-3-methyladenine glycosylase II [Litoreibacter ascidiaceicola]|uniref:DNA-3-methyladenine glycosylase II n=1 Tax=Litoreibacter ascidiaceicola TaxID=1486859 RepID=A0A1M4SEX5_9RHOB|nr:DNA-3-methyladenine glycosylase [Litoreibacter ascidiaceicola]SHE30712.1 DNA-3-methyladenine glycosylase II [Litoreibacter ascidiaceicola]
MRIIKGDRCVAEGAAWLAEREPRFAQALTQVGKLPLRLKPEGFSELLSAIMGQQVSIASAAAINGRLRDAGLIDARAVAAASEDELRACGLSRQKIRYAHALATSGIDFNALRDKSTSDVIQTLTAVPGIGSWTAEIYAMFSLGHADVFASGDLALQEAARILFELPDRPKEKEMRQMALDWSPWQSVAARILWAYYRVAKDREGIT